MFACTAARPVNLNIAGCGALNLGKHNTMKMIGLARLGRDAEVRRTPGGDAVANLSLAYVCGRKKDGDEYAPSQWIDASLWGAQAEALAQYLKKGSVHCFTIADVRTEEYTDKDDYLRTKLVGRVDSVELGPRQGDAPAGGERRERPASNAGGQQRTQNKPAGGGSAPEDDDIPF